MKFLIDMNLSPAWVEVLKQASFEAIHWSEIGTPKASDTILSHIFQNSLQNIQMKIK